MAIADVLRSTLHVPGHVAEFGCWRGANAVFLAKLLRIYDQHGPKVVHGFDSFQGLSGFRTEDKWNEEKAGKYKGSYEELLDMIELYELQDDIVIHEGLIEETLPLFLRENESARFSFVYCDTDLFESTRVILNLLHPRLCQGGVFVFDEWNREDYPGEGVAVNQFLDQHKKEYEVNGLLGTRQPTLVVRKLMV
jgi:hypothetical protein